MSDIQNMLFPVSFTTEHGHPRLVALTDASGTALTRPASPDPEDALKHLCAEAEPSLPHPLTPLLAGVEPHGAGVRLIHLAPVTSPAAERDLEIAEEHGHRWTELSGSTGRRTGDRPECRSGPESVVLDHLRQMLEETDIALDFMPHTFTLWQLRRLYDAVWGYDQDPSGFKRWAVGRTGALNHLIDEVGAGTAVDEEYYSALAQELPPAAAVAAATLSSDPERRSASVVETRRAIAASAARSVNRLYPKPGPEPTWYVKSARWRPGPTWLPHVYPPRPAWTRWDVTDDAVAALGRG